MGRAFTSIGVVALVGAVGWWHTFYGQIDRLLGATVHCPLNVFAACPRLAAWWRTLPNYSERDRIIL